MSVVREGRWDIKIFIAQHDHIRYCEACLNPDGTIEYTIPSHISVLMQKAIGVSYDDIANDMTKWGEVQAQIPNHCDAIDYFVEKSGCVAIWYDYLLCPPEMTQAQKRCFRLINGVRDNTNKRDANFKPMWFSLLAREDEMHGATENV